MKENRQEIINQREAAILNKNWDRDHTRPAVPHYDHKWLWDSAFAADIYAKLGNPEKAAIEITSLFNGMDSKTGFIPNMNYLTGHNWRDIEALTFKRHDIGSSYTQPPILAWATWETFDIYQRQGKSSEGRRFLQDTFDNLTSFYAYFSKYRENGNGSQLVGNIHPHETGRDSDPSLRPNLLLLPGKGKVAGLANGLLDYGTILTLNAKLYMQDQYPGKGRPTVYDIVSFKKRKERKEERKVARYDWDPEKVRNVYWINDVMFNVLYANNLQYMGKISQELGKGRGNYESQAKKVEQEILTKMWNEEDGLFYNLDKNGKQIKVASITSLFPMLLDTISEHQLTKLVDKMEDPKWFGTPFPIPSVPANSRHYHPHYTEPRLWKRGEVWINTNQLIAEEGLVKQIQREDLSPEIRERMTSVLKNLAEKTEKLVAEDLLTTETSHEFYDPDPEQKKHWRKTDKKTGKVIGYRIPGFTWSLGGLHLDKSKKLLEENES